MTVTLSYSSKPNKISLILFNKRQQKDIDFIYINIRGEDLEDKNIEMKKTEKKEELEENIKISKNTMREEGIEDMKEEIKMNTEENR